MKKPPDKSLPVLRSPAECWTKDGQPLEPSGKLRISSPAASRSDSMPVAVRLQPTEPAAKSPPRRVATAERISSSRSRGLFYIAVPARPAIAGSGRYAFMRIVHSIVLRYALVAILLSVTFMFTPKGWTSPESTDAIQRGQKFLMSLFDPDLSLLPEYRGANVYWLFHDNYLAAKVLAVGHPQTAKRIMAAIHREGIFKSGKIELIFGEAEKPLPFRQYQLMDVRSVTNKIIRTEIVTDRVLDDWEDYADLLLLACIAEGNHSLAHQHWDAAMRLWDGNGFLDAAARHDHRYSTYKLGLALLAAGHLSLPVKLPQGLIARLLAMQDDSGGWITDYDASGKKIGLANVETTCLCILGLEASPELRHSPMK